MKRVLLAKHKHGKTAYDISTKELRDKVSLVLLRSRLRDGTYQSPGEEIKELTEKQIEELPPGLRPMARSLRLSNNIGARNWRRSKQIWDDIERANLRDDGELAWNVLVAREGYEYEGLEAYKIQEVVPSYEQEAEVALSNLREEVKSLKVEVEKWKRRAAKHGCNVDEGDGECG